MKRLSAIVAMSLLCATAPAAPPPKSAKPAPTPAVRPAEGVLRLEFTEATTQGENPVWRIKNYALVPAGYGMPPRLSLRPFRSAQNADRNVDGTATTTFAGAEGYYTLAIECFDKDAGCARFSLKVDGKTVSRWAAGNSFFGVTPLRHVVPHVALRKGSVIEISGQTNGYDFADLKALEIAPGAPRPPAPPVAVGGVKYSETLLPLVERVPCLDPALMIPPPSRAWPDAGAPADLAAAPLYLFRAAQGERFEVQVNNPDMKDRVHLWSVRRRPVAEGPGFDGRLDVPAQAGARIRVEIPRDGLYEMRVGGSVTGLTHGLTLAWSGPVGHGCFFVPEKTAGLRLKSSDKSRQGAEVTLRDSSGAVVWDGDIAAHKHEDIAVPPGRDGMPWTLSCPPGRGVTIEGVPPYLALAAADLLVPEEALPARATPPAAVPRLPLRVKPLADAAMMKGCAPVVLVRDGQPACVIVTPPDPSPAHLKAARTLQQFLLRISGATVPLSDRLPDRGAAILLGVAGDFPAVTPPKGFDAFNAEGLFLRTGADRLAIMARSAAGLSPAVHTFLQRLGCRWYFGDEDWEVIPQARDITVALDVATQPDFLLRNITSGTRAIAGARDMDLWSERNRLGSGIRGGIHHSYSGFVPDALFKEHPEYFALKDTNKDGVGDVRTPAQPCTTHPEVVKLFTAGCVVQGSKEPNLDLLPVSPNDGTVNMCRCERCRAVGSYSDCAWLLAHQVADAVRAAMPRRAFWIGFYAYGVVSTPPRLKAEADPNIAIQIATAYNRVSVDTMFDAWPAYVGVIGVREYFAIPQWGANAPGRGITVSKARRVIPYYKSRKAIMLNAEACPVWGGAGIGMYVAAQLMWDSTQNPDALLAEFYADCFGAAALPMRRYFERWEREGFNPRTAKLALGDLREALDKADDIESRRRVALCALYIHALRIDQEWAALDDKTPPEQRARFQQEAGIFLWRNHRNGLYRLFGSVAGARFAALPFFTFEETRGLVERDLALLAGVEAADLVTQFGGAMTRVPTEAVGQLRAADDGAAFPAATWMVLATKGRPIVIEATGKGGRVEARLLRLSGNDAAERKELVLADERGEIRLIAPEDGPCRLAIAADKAHYRIVEPAASAIVLAREKNREWFRINLPSGTNALCFYVPIGAEAILFGFGGKARGGTVMELQDNKGQTVLSARADARTGQFGLSPRIVHVPPGGDHQVWRVQLGAPVSDAAVFLKGVPPYAHLDPARLIVPERGADDDME